MTQTKAASTIRGVLQRKCACEQGDAPRADSTEHRMQDGFFQREPICLRAHLQTELAVGASDDPLEHEADRVADAVMAAPMQSPGASILPEIRRSPAAATKHAEAVPDSVLQVISGSGKPMEPALRQAMATRFGQDFSQVRVHSSAMAEQSTRDVNANAYTVGHNVVFGRGQFAPETPEGQRLIAHELAHVVQQTGVDQHRFGQGDGKRGLSAVSLGLSGRLVQRDPATSTNGSFAPTLNQQYSAALQLAKRSGNWQDAAEKLNGFSQEDIQSRLAQLTQEQVRFMRQGALDNPRVGPGSNVARMAAEGATSGSNTAAGTGGFSDDDDDPRADERSKQRRQQERRQQRREKATEGRAMDKCSEIGRVFDSKEAVLSAIRKELLPEAVEGNTPSTVTGNAASHPVRHIGIYTDSSKTKYAGTIFSQKCADESGVEKAGVAWTTDIISGNGVARIEDRKTKNQVSTKPTITDLHSGLTPLVPILVSQANRLFPQAQPGSEFVFTASAKIVETYLNPIALESFRKLVGVQEKRQFLAERSFHVVALGVFGAELLVAIAVAVGAGAAAGATGTGAATGAAGTGATGLAPVIPLFEQAPKALAAAAAVTLVLMDAKRAHAGEAPPTKGSEGQVKVVPASLLGSQPQVLGSVVTVGGQKEVVVGRFEMR